MKPTLEQAEKDVALHDSKHSPFRAGAARANYLAPDRPDIEFAVTELCRRMAAPRTDDFEKLRRLAKYLVGRPRLIMKYAFQPETDCLSIFFGQQLGWL